MTFKTYPTRDSSLAKFMEKYDAILQKDSDDIEAVVSDFLEEDVEAYINDEPVHWAEEG